MARLLVTGGAGFIGANFVHYWVQQYPQDRIVVLDALTYAGNHASLDSVAGNEQYRFVKGDIVDREFVEALMREEHIDTLVHFAAESHVDRSISGPAAFIDTNIVGTHNLLQAARSVWLDSDDAPAEHRFHHVSTDEVYGSLGPTDPGFSESTAYSPNSPYSASKAASDHLVRAYHHTYGLQVSTSNCSNNYGPFQFPEKLIPLILLNAQDFKPLPIYGDGLQVRDWLFVHDHVDAINAVLERGVSGEVYNIGGSSERTNLQVVNGICDALDQRRPDAASGPRRDLIEHVTDRPGHDRRYAIDCSKLSGELGWQPAVNFETGLARTIDWYLENTEWVGRVQDGSYQGERLGLTGAR